MSENGDQYWACTVCDAGGHPLTMAQAFERGQSHLESAGHFTVWGKIGSS